MADYGTNLGELHMKLRALTTIELADRLAAPIFWLFILALFLANYHFSIASITFVLESGVFPPFKTSASPPYSVGLVDSIAVSLFRVVVGSTLGFLLGLATGLLLYQIPKSGWKILVLIRFFAPLPAIVWLPILFKYFGIGTLTGIILVSTTAVLVTAIVTYSLAVRVKQAYVDALLLMGAGRSQLLKYVVLPSLLPTLFLLLRLNLFAGWASLLAAEMAGAEAGLGAMLILGRSLGNYSIIAVATALIATVAFLLDLMLSMAANSIVSKRFGARFGYGEAQ